MPTKQQLCSVQLQEVWPDEEDGRTPLGGESAVQATVIMLP